MIRVLIIIIIFFISHSSYSNEVIYHEKFYPENNKKSPAIIALHTSGGYSTVKKVVKPFLKAGFVVYTPNFFVKHNITKQNRFETWTKYKEPIEKELVQIVDLMKKDIKVDNQNIFAVGYSNGGYWASFLAAKNYVNAGVSYYGVWKWPRTFNGYPAKYFSEKSNPVLALIGLKDTIQKYSRNSSEINFIKKNSSKFKVHFYDNAGHSWDSKKSKDGYSKSVTDDSFQKSIIFFKANMK
jgi:dienelactone hydrolase